MENPSYRVLLVGETTAGKTCILNRIVNQEFREDTMDTINMFYSKEIVTNNNKKINLEFWDTPGHEKDRSLNKIFHRDVDVVLLVYNVTKRESFEEIKSYHYQNSKHLAVNACKVINIYINSIYLSRKCL